MGVKLSMAEAVKYINTHPEGFLQRDGSGKGFICPVCGSGSGAKGTGLRLNTKDKDHTHYKCFACGLYGDMIELIAQSKGLDGSSGEAFKAAREIYGIELIPDDKQTEPQPIKKKSPPEAQPQQDKSAEVRAYLQRSQGNIEAALPYLTGRGISRETAQAAGVGYDPQRQAVVIPIGSASEGIGYTWRYTANPVFRYGFPEGAKAGFFNYAALTAKEPVFVVEGSFDALSILEMGFPAIALNSVGNAAGFIDFCKVLRDKAQEADKAAQFPKLLIAMDNDDAGIKASEALSEGLQGAGFDAQRVQIAQGHKDANEALQADRRALRDELARAYYPELASAIEPYKVKSLLPAFKEYIQDSKANKSYPTGFKNFDKAIGGGLFAKLYVIGAIPSLGKTTLALQIADQLAQAGRDVLIFSLEMAKEDIIARSISRGTYLIAQAKHDMRLARSELDIVAYYERQAHYTADDKQALSEAYTQYEAYAGERISIIEGKQTVRGIRETIERYIRYTGRKPIVVIDYLQIIKPDKELIRATVKEQVDDTIDVLAAIRRDLKIPVIAISSFNRGSYNSEADSTAFKESGEIEYTGDCVITLELDINRDYKKGDTQSGKKDTKAAMRGENGIRKIKLVFQKNRGNRVGSEVYFDYVPKYNYFSERTDKEAIL